MTIDINHEEATAIRRALEHYNSHQQSEKREEAQFRREEAQFRRLDALFREAGPAVSAGGPGE